MKDQVEKLRNSNTWDKFRFLAKDSLVYGGLSALTKFFSIFLTPVLTGVLAKEEYGNMDILNPILATSATIIVFGMDSAVARFYYNTDDVVQRKLVVSNAFWTQIVVSGLILILLFLFKEEFLNLYLGVSNNNKQADILFIIMILIFFTTPIRFAQNLLRWTFKRKQFLILSIGFILVNFISIILSVKFMQDKLEAVYLGQVIPSVVFALLSLFFLRPHLVFKIETRLLRKMLIYGVPLVIVAFIPALVPAIDRYVINKHLGLEDVANYGIGYRIASFVGIPILSINTALGPFILSLYKEKDAERIFNLILNAVIIVISTLIMIISIMSPLFLNILASKDFSEGLLVVAPLCFYLLVEMQRTISSVGIDLSMKTYWNLILYPLSTIILYIILEILTPGLGIFGAANALMISGIINYILFTIVGTKLYPIKYNLVDKILVMLLAYGICLLNQFYLSDTALQGLIAFLSSLFFLVLSFYLLINKSDRLQVFERIKNQFRKLTL